MTWEIVLGIIALFGFIVSVVTPILKLTRVMTELNISVASLKESINQINEKNSESHKRIWEHNEHQDQKIDDHERRIGKIEYDIEKYHRDPNYHEHHNHTENTEND